LNISVNLVVRNEVNRLESWVKNIRPYVDEVVIVDQQSDDGTTELARDLADVFVSDKYTGTGDTSRELALVNSSSPWILVLDADETLVEDVAKQLHEMTDVGYDGYTFRVSADHLGLPDFAPHYRLFNKGKVKLSTELHAAVMPVSANVFHFPGVSIMHDKHPEDIRKNAIAYTRYSFEKAKVAGSDVLSSNVPSLFGVQYHGLRISIKDGRIKFSSEVDGPELEFGKATFKSGDKCLVAGGGQGAIATVLAQGLGTPNIFVYEANPYLIKDLEGIRINNSGLKIRHGAISTFNGETSFYVNETWYQSSLNPNRDADTSEVWIPVFDINDVIRENNINTLHLDVEGAEYSIFRHLDLEPLRAMVVEVHSRDGDINEIFEVLGMNDFVVTLSHETEGTTVFAAERKYFQRSPIEFSEYIEVD
jgi:FkbM family methyltransferase